MRALRVIGFTAMVLALIVIGILSVGGFTTDWSCSCAGADQWKCTGGHCSAAATDHIAATRHAVTCHRTDRPIRGLDDVFSWLLR